MHGDPLFFQEYSHALADFPIQQAEYGGQVFDHGHLTAEGIENTGILQTDHPAPDNCQAGRDLVYLQ